MTEIDAVKIMEDNEAAIKLVTNGGSKSDRSKHVHIRNCFITQYIKNGTLKIEYCPTEKMIADLFTKPLPKALFLQLRAYLLGYKVIA